MAGETKVKPWNTEMWVDDIDSLKSLDPTVDGQAVILPKLKNGSGGGIFIYDLSDVTTEEDEGYCIVTQSGKRFKRYTSPSSLSIVDFGASEKDTDVNTPFSSLKKLIGRVNVPSGLFKYLGTVFGSSVIIRGVGQLYSDSIRYAKNTISISKPPASLGNEDSIVSAFNGDQSLVDDSWGVFISGKDTLGTPKSGYKYTPEVIPHYTYLMNQSGHNESLSDNEGRTGLPAYRAKVAQYGQGDLFSFNGSAFIASKLEGAKHFLANPAVGIINGDLQSGADGGYFNPIELIMHDEGYDMAAVGFVANFNRTNDTGKLSTIWHGARIQSVGTKPIDAVLSFTGQSKVGLDFSIDAVDFGSNNAAISLKAGQRIYLNNASEGSGNTEAGWHADVFNGDFISYDTDHINLVAGGNPVLQVSKDVAITTKPMNVLGGLMFPEGVISHSATAGSDRLPEKPVMFITVLVGASKTPYKLPLYNL